MYRTPLPPQQPQLAVQVDPQGAPPPGGWSQPGSPRPRLRDVGLRRSRAPVWGRWSAAGARWGRRGERGSVRAGPAAMSGPGAESLRGQLRVGRATEKTVGTLIPHNILRFESHSYRLDEIYLNLEETSKQTKGNMGTQKAHVTALDGWPQRPPPRSPRGVTGRGCSPRGGSRRPRGPLTSLGNAAQLSRFLVLRSL